MKREAGGPCLSAVFVDYDNIYLSLKRKNEEAAKRFAKDAGLWIREIEAGRIITATNAPFDSTKRRIVMNRCYGNPVPRRNAHDNSTDMNSFPFVRHHFLRAGFEVIDCPPLTAQLKNSSDIRMVMDVRDYLTHDTYFDEFIILSGDADFTPVLHRLRAHARRTVIFANDFTAAPYTAISDGEVREADLIALIMEGGDMIGKDEGAPTLAAPPSTARLEAARAEIMAEIVSQVRSSPSPVPLESLAERAVRSLGHDKTVATGWAGAGSFSELLRQSLPNDVRLTDEPPYMVFDPKRHLPAGRAPQAQALQSRDIPHEPVKETRIAPKPLATAAAPQAPLSTLKPAMSVQAQAPASAPIVPAASAPTPGASAIQQSIARIHEACQAPPMAPHEYRLLFELMAKEINENDLIGAQTLANITQQAQDRGLDVRRDDVRFVLEVVSEADPWFEQGASANLFAGRFRNFVVARCRGQGLNLSADELDLIDAWFAGGSLPASSQTQAPVPAPAPTARSSGGGGRTAAPAPAAETSSAGAGTAGGGRWWSQTAPAEEPRPAAGGAGERSSGAASMSSGGGAIGGDEFPRIVRTRLRG